MSYVNNTHRRADPTRRNGIIHQTQYYLDSLGSWGTCRDAGSIKEIPERITQLTVAYFSLKGLALASAINSTGTVTATNRLTNSARSPSGSTAKPWSMARLILHSDSSRP